MTSSVESSAPRRSQEQRRAATVAKLVDATIAAIGEVGYHRASVHEICSRAGLSVGAMFRRFDGRLDLIVRTAEQIVDRQLQAFRRTMDHLDAEQNRIDIALRFLRQAQAANTTHALREIYMAARSDSELRDRISPAVEAYYQGIIDTVEQAGLFADVPQDRRKPLFFMMLYLFSGEAVVDPVYSPPGLDEAVLSLTEDMLRSYLTAPEH